MAFSLLRVGVRAACAIERGIIGVGSVKLLENVSTEVSSRNRVQVLITNTNTSVLATRLYSKQTQTKREQDFDSDSDSDSDDERKERGTSDFWRLKIRNFHGVIDVNKDGVVSYDDFKILADRFIKLGHLTPKQKQEFNDALKHVWEEQWGIVDKYNMVTTEQYLENMHHVLNDKSLKRKAHKFLPYLFKAVDKDQSGTISVAEFKLFFKCLGLNQDDATISFESIDINKDGLISLKEFVKYGREYFLTENENKPSKYFWGPLVMP